MLAAKVWGTLLPANQGALIACTPPAVHAGETEAREAKLAVGSGSELGHDNVGVSALRSGCLGHSADWVPNMALIFIWVFALAKLL